MPLFGRGHPGPPERPADSDSPLAPFADVQTPDEAMAARQGMSPEQQTAVYAMFAE